MSENSVQGDPAADPSREPRTLEAIHRDVDFANRYRLEFIKHCMSLAAAVFVFTVTFIKEIVPDAQAEHKWLIAVSWSAMIVSLLAGLGHLARWDRYFISHRDHRYNRARGDQVRARITFWGRIVMALQLLGFFVGLAAVAAFCFLNL